ncbi:MAG: hypothetical protein JRJ31_08525 [Deltaproteobacteria bacterium]|nr:hypothetical protein [Deltaproteobacteria bacterium]
MKCPKCGYVSFDYNQACPKCTKDISSEQQKMNLPPFRPDPPMLLGSLIGEADESQSLGIADDSSEIEFQSDTMMTFDETAVVEGDEMAFGDSGAIEEGDVSFEGADAIGEDEAGLSDEEDLGLELELDDAGGEGSSGDSTATIPEEDVVADFPLEDQDDSSEIAVDEIAFDDLEDDEEAPPDRAGQEPSLEPGKEDQGSDSDSLDLDLGPEGELDLDLDDLELDDGSDRQNAPQEADSGPGEEVLGDDSFPEEFTLEDDRAREDGQASELDEPALGEDEASATKELKDIEDALDLEDLDIDLELEDSGPQKST